MEKVIKREGFSNLPHGVLGSSKTLKEASSMVILSTFVAFNSFALGTRASSHLPKIKWSEIAFRCRFSPRYLSDGHDDLFVFVPDRGR